jgi:hypothetical protein
LGSDDAVAKKPKRKHDDVAAAAKNKDKKPSGKSELLTKILSSILADMKEDAVSFGAFERVIVAKIAASDQDGLDRHQLRKWVRKHLKVARRKHQLVIT